MIISLRRHRPCPRQIAVGALAVGLLLLLCFRLAETGGYLNLASKDLLFMGDEPKYLRMTYSLMRAGDLDLTNLVTWPDERKQIREEARRKGSFGFGDLYVVGVKGGIYSLHMPGFSAFILPAYILDSRLSPPNPQKAPTANHVASDPLFFLPEEMIAVRLWLMATAMGVLLLLFRLLDNILRSLVLTGLGLLLFILVSPFPDYALQMYPEAAATFFSLLALNALLFPFRRKRVNDLLLVIGIGALPWFHQRYIPLAFGLFCAFLIFRRRTGASLKKIMGIGLCLFLLSLPYFYYFYSITGSPSPMSPIQIAYGGTFARWSTLLLGFFGQIFHLEWGLLWVYPWFFLFLMGVYQGLKTDRKISLAQLAVLAPYYLMCSAAVPWNGAAFPPGRFLVAAFPIFVVFAMIFLRDILRRPALPRLMIYGAWALGVGLNTVFRFEKFDFGFKVLNPQEWARIALCLVIVLALYLSLFWADRFSRFRNQKP